MLLGYKEYAGTEFVAKCEKDATEIDHPFSHEYRNNSFAQKELLEGESESVEVAREQKRKRPS